MENHTTNRQLNTIATTSPPPTTSEHAAGFRLVGPKALTLRNYEPRDVTRNHAIYDQTLDIAEVRQVTCLETGVKLKYILPPGVHEEMLRAGKTRADIAQAEAIIIDTISDHPKWEVTRSMPSALWHQLRKEGREDLIDKNRIVAVPGNTANALICNQLLTMFSQSELLSCPGFVLRRYDGEEGEKPYYGLRLDLEDWHARSGFIVPVVDGRGMILALRVFRRPNDTRPFILKSRGGEVHLGS